MDDLPAQLGARLSRLNADLHLDLLDPAGAVWLACDLLVADVETPALIDLAGESPTRLTRADAEPLVRQMLTELDMEPLDTLRASWIVAGDIARQIVEGNLPPEDGARSMWGLWWSCDCPEEIEAIVEPLDAWDETVPANRDDEAIRTQMRDVARGILRAATTRLATDRVIGSRRKSATPKAPERCPSNSAILSSRRDCTDPSQ